MHLATVDGEGRLLLPKPVKRYLQTLGENAPFVTSFDRQTARIYPRSIWVQEVQPLLQRPGQYSDAARVLCFVGNWLGTDATMNRLGQLQLGDQLREVLDLDSRRVWIYHERGHFAVLPESVYLRRCEELRAETERSLADLERAGLS